MPPRDPRHLALSSIAFLLTVVSALATSTLTADDGTDLFKSINAGLSGEVGQLLRDRCIKCHSTLKKEGELDLEQFSSETTLRRGIQHWQKSIEMIELGEMPPENAEPLTVSQQASLLNWLKSVMQAEAKATAGDPGPVVLRRLNNAEYTYTIQELTKQPLRPADQFPADSASGEGFTNTGSTLVMSPALFDKYVDAAKRISDHAVLLPDGIRFSPYTTPRDWADDAMLRIRQLYSQYTDPSGATRVNLQGLVWDTNQGGRLPLRNYLAELIKNREALKSRTLSTEQLATTSKLNAKYLEALWSELNHPSPSLLLRQVQTEFARASLDSVDSLTKQIEQWQSALSRFQSVGHMKPWIVAQSPLLTSQEIRVKDLIKDGQSTLTLHFASRSVAGMKSASSLPLEVELLEPRFTRSGQPDLLLRDVEKSTQTAIQFRAETLRHAGRALKAAGELLNNASKLSLDELAAKHEINIEVLQLWLDYMNIGPAKTASISDLYTNQLNKVGNFDFAKGWGSPETPSIVANSSDESVRIPGKLKPHGVVVHPAPQKNAVIAWQAPDDLLVNIRGSITHAHPECGNGVTWSVEVRRGQRRVRLASGASAGSKEVPFPELSPQRVHQGEMIVLAIGPKDGNHSCDLTDVDLEIVQQGQPASSKTWNLRTDVSSNILDSNPHRDSYGNARVWHFGSEPILPQQSDAEVIPAESILSNWIVTEDAERQSSLADELQGLIDRWFENPETANSKSNDADKKLLLQMTRFDGPLLRYGVHRVIERVRREADQHGDSKNIMLQANTLSRELSVELLASTEFVTNAKIAARNGNIGATQIRVATQQADSLDTLSPALPILIADQPAVRSELEGALHDFRQLFPAALCYMKIVPVDEVVTLALYHREDENLQRLMLSSEEAKRLDALWEELHFVSRDPITVKDAYDQLMQYATQDSDPRLFEHLRAPIEKRLAEFKADLLEAEPVHVQACIDFAKAAYRRPLQESEAQNLRALYARVREEGLEHDDTIRLLIARILVSPSFLYRLEDSPDSQLSGSAISVSASSSSAPVNDWELATRLSYFLWSSPPDAELLKAAEAKSLREPDTLKAQLHRMLKDSRVDRLANEFACQWLQVQDVATLNEKSERHFPEFAEVRESLQEEVKRFFTKIIAEDRSVLELIDADYVLVNGRLAKHYGIDLPNVSDDQWQSVPNARSFHRGGILTLGATLSKQSGASRTSPILRGNWISEVLLGEHLPKPPKDVPALPTDEAGEALTVRQLIEKHAADARCSKCHKKIDAYGIALEQFDAIGRLRDKDLAGHPIDSQVALPDGTSVDGIDGLRDYLMSKQRDRFVRHFCKKLVGYALGRSVQLSDEDLLTSMQQKLIENEYRISSALEVLVTSRQFTHRRIVDE